LLTSFNFSPICGVDLGGRRCPPAVSERLPQIAGIARFSNGLLNDP
jgi:hypothetical protein